MQIPKLPIFSLGTFDQTTRNNAKVRYKQVSSMKLSQFLEIFLQNSYLHILTAMGLRCLSVQTLKNHERMELSWGNNVYATDFSVETRLEHGYAIENTHFL